MFHKVKSVNSLPNYKLSVQFSEGITKIYDVSLLFDKWPAFKCFINAPELFEDVEVDKGVLTLKAYESLEKVADGQATKILIPSEIQGIAGLAKSIVEVSSDKAE